MEAGQEDREPLVQGVDHAGLSVPLPAGARCGIPTLPLALLPVRESSRWVPSTCQETEGPVRKGRSDLPMTSQSLMRQNQEVLRHTRRVLAHSPGLRPESVASTKRDQVTASSLEAEGRPLLLAEKVRPHPLRSHL